MFGWFRKKKEEPQPEEQWAFWPSDVFPYFDSGLVDDFTEDGRVRVNHTARGEPTGEYAYFYIASGERGRELHNLGCLLCRRFHIHMEAARNGAGNAAHAILTEMGFPKVDGLVQSGYQGSGYRKYFTEDLPEKYRARAMKDGEHAGD